MSRVYFTTETDEAELRGSERAHADILTRDLATSVVGSVWDSADHPTHWRRVVPESEYSIYRKDIKFENHVRRWLQRGMFGGAPATIDGVTIDVWTLCLNTAVRLGSDPVKFMARLHAQCEIHGYVEEQNREWLAGIIDEGLDVGIMREDQWWDRVVTLLRDGSPGPVVTSYSVCDGFPNDQIVRDEGVWTPEIKKYEDTEEDDDFDFDEKWGALGEAEQWRLGLEAIRRYNERGWIEWTPEGWDDYHFGVPLTIFDLERWAWKLEREAKESPVSV